MFSWHQNERNLCFDVNTTWKTTWCVTLQPVQLIQSLTWAKISCTTTRKCPNFSQCLNMKQLLDSLPRGRGRRRPSCRSTLGRWRAPPLRSNLRPRRPFRRVYWSWKVIMIIYLLSIKQITMKDEVVNKGERAEGSFLRTATYPLWLSWFRVMWLL